MPKKQTKKTVKRQPLNQMSDCCAQAPIQRRSIPVAEVNHMLDKQRVELQKAPTLYDRRVDLVNQLEYLERNKSEHYERVRGITLEIVETRKQLEAVNQDIHDELLMDSTR